ncbi:NADH-quinone oxidoreductase subunit J family protein [Marinoscillum furvescens]|nr:NADH-quinone oxidoreductase subunit J [Marinoscillum furvescens]
MAINKLFFFFFAAMTVLPVIYILFTGNIVRSAFALVVSLLGVAALYVLLQAEVMAVVQLLIYAGGIIVLLLFGIMLTRRLSEEGVFAGHRGVVIGALMALMLFGMLVRLILGSGLEFETAAPVTDQVAHVGIAFLTDHIVAFELVAYLLLVALVGAAFLAKKSDKA